MSAAGTQIDIHIQEVLKFHDQLASFERRDSPIFYQVGRTKVRIDRELTIRKTQVAADKKVVIERFAKKDSEGKFISIETIATGPLGEKTKVWEYDFGDKEMEARKMLEDIDMEYYHTKDGKPVMVSLEIFKVSSELANKMKGKDWPAMGYIYEYLFPEDYQP